MGFAAYLEPMEIPPIFSFLFFSFLFGLGFFNFIKFTSLELVLVRERGRHLESVWCGMWYVVWCHTDMVHGMVMMMMRA